jgi:hypothetical protein
MFNVAKIRKAAAPIIKDPAEARPEAAPQQGQEPPQEAAKPSPGAAPTSGWVDLKKAHKDIGDLLKNPAGKEVEVKSMSKAGVHTFTITVKPTEMMARAEQNGGVQQPAPQAAAPDGHRGISPVSFRAGLDPEGREGRKEGLHRPFPEAAVPRQDEGPLAERDRPCKEPDRRPVVSQMDLPRRTNGLPAVSADDHIVSFCPDSGAQVAKRLGKEPGVI